MSPVTKLFTDGFPRCHHKICSSFFISAEIVEVLDPPLQNPIVAGFVNGYI
jgi:hypothetical protein